MYPLLVVLLFIASLEWPTYIHNVQYLIHNDIKHIVTHLFCGYQSKGSKLDTKCNTNIKCDNSHHHSFYSVYDKDFVDQEQCGLLFCTWNCQPTCCLQLHLKIILAETLENDNTTLVPSQHFTIKILEIEKESFSESASQLNTRCKS